MKIIIFTTKGSIFGKKLAETAYKNNWLQKILYVNPGYKNHGLIASAFIYFKKYGISKGIIKIFEKIFSLFKAPSSEIPSSYYLNTSHTSHTELAKTLKELNPDICIAASYRKILPQKIITSTKKFINLHPSLLPKYRGANPIYWTLKNKDKFTGITYHFLEKEIDSGNIILQERIPIEKNDQELSLKLKCAIKAAEKLKMVIDKLEKGYKGIKQDPKNVTFAPDHK